MTDIVMQDGWFRGCVGGKSGNFSAGEIFLNGFGQN